MTEANDEGNNLVRVRAQVMMRDDSTGGWVPMGGGGLSNVSVCKRIIQPESRHEYFIHGKRISDQSVVLSCTIKKDFEYNKVMPTFHHWRTGDHKFGLTFQTAADARTFDNGVRTAVDDLRNVLRRFPNILHNVCTDAGEEDIFIAVTLPVERDGSLSSSGSAATTYSNSSRHTPTTTPLAATTPLPTPDHLHHHSAGTTTPDPPPPHVPHHHHLHHHLHHLSTGGGSSLQGGIATNNTSPASTLSHPGSIASSAPNQGSNYYCPSNHMHFNRLNYVPRTKAPGSISAGKASPVDGDKGDQEKVMSLGETYSYVQLAKTNPPALHDYSYPMVEPLNKGDRRDSIASLKKQQQIELVGGTATEPASLASGKRRMKGACGNRKNIRFRCRHCNENFLEDFNSRGSCEYSPDGVRTAIETLTCIRCAQCLLYHCMSDAEGEFPQHPCECDGATDVSCGKRWIGLTFLSLIVPCLWCYLPLRACHRCAVSCRLCGGRHEAS